MVDQRVGEEAPFHRIGRLPQYPSDNNRGSGSTLPQLPQHPSDNKGKDIMEQRCLPKFVCTVLGTRFQQGFMKPLIIKRQAPQEGEQQAGVPVKILRPDTLFARFPPSIFTVCPANNSTWPQTGFRHKKRSWKCGEGEQWRQYFTWPLCRPQRITCT